MDGGQLIAEEWGNELIQFVYDASGTPVALNYRNSSFKEFSVLEGVVKTDYISVINRYIGLYGEHLSFDYLTLSLIQKNNIILDECIDFLLDIFCLHGLKDDYEPNDMGNELETLVDYLMTIRRDYHE